MSQSISQNGDLRSPRRFAMIPRPDHPGYFEGMLVSGSRVLASGAIFAALILSLGGGHLAIAALAALPFLGRLSHLVVPALIRCHSSARIAQIATWFERGGLLIAAAAGIVKPEGYALPLLLTGFGICVLGQSVYDVTMASLHTEACAAGAFGRYSACKTRWASTAGMLLGLLVSVALDGIERQGVPPHVARGISILTGVCVHLMVTFALRRMIARAESLARDHAARRAARGTPALGSARVATTGSVPRQDRKPQGWLTLPRTKDHWAIVRFGMAWGAASGISLRQSEAMAITVLGVSVGGVLLLNALLVGTGILGAGTWGRLVDRFGGKGLMSVALLALALDPVWTLAALFIHPAMLIPSYALWGIFNSGWNIAAGVTLVRTSGPSADRIRTLAMFNVAYGLGAGTTPVLGGLLLEVMDTRFSPVVAYATLFAIATTLRLSTYPLLRAMPAPPAERGSYVSRVMLRAVRRRVRRRGERIAAGLRAADRVLLSQR